MECQILVMPTVTLSRRLVWLGMFAAELWFGLYRILTQSLRWNLLYRHTCKYRLSKRERQDAIAELRGVHQPHVLSLRKELSKLPDMERLVARIFAGSEGSGRIANKVVLYEDACVKKAAP